jgi:hypothetical protein
VGWPALSDRRNISFVNQVEHCEPELTTLARNPLMMRKITVHALLYIFVFLFVFPFAWPVLAHGGEPRLEISVERINPGGVMEVRGVDFDYDEPVVLSLMRSEIQIPLIEVTADGEGLFTQNIALPADLPAGEYNFRAKSDHHTILSPTITVSGVAVQDQEDNAIRDQSDVQLGPLPTFAPGFPSTPLPQPAAEEPPVSRRNSTTLIYSILAGVGILAFLSIRILKKR